MRVIHFADLHIGVETYGRPLPERGWSSRMQDFLDAFDELVERAISDQTDAVIFAGDAYKAREPSQTHQREFAKRIRRLSEAGVATFLVAGNHDLPNAEGRANTLEIYRTLDVPNVYVGDNAWFVANGFRPQVMQTRSGPLQVAFVPWPQVSRMLAAEEEVAHKSIDEQMVVVEQRLGALIREQAEALDPALPSVLAAHLSVNDFLVRSNQGSEQWMTIGTSPTVLKSALCEQSFDYIALGHHHNNMDLGLNTPCWYSGSMQRVDFGEEKQEKGFMAFEIDAAKPVGARVGGSGLPRFERVTARHFVTVEVNPKDDDPTAEICRAIEKKTVTDAIVRVQIAWASGDQARQFRMHEARRLLEDAHFVAGIQGQLPGEARTRLPVGVQPDAASPIEALDIYFRTQNLEEARRERLKRAAEELLAAAGVANV
jgi:DNA repair protein SbcD/Mre11